MNSSAFVSYILILVVGWVSFYSAVRETFNGITEYEAEIRRLERESEESRLGLDLEREHFLEFRQYVAGLMPGVLMEKGEGEAGYPYRNLASTVSRGQANQVRNVIIKTLFESGKDRFRKKEYQAAIRAFKKLVDRFGYSPYVTESFFLMAESYFQLGELEECTAVIQQMIELFPQAELTGFAMVRLGRIYEIQNRSEEAVDIYKTVLRSYPQRDVASQARASLRGVDL